MSRLADGSAFDICRCDSRLYAESNPRDTGKLPTEACGRVGNMSRGLYLLIAPRAAPVNPLQYVMAHDAPHSMAALMQQTTIGIPVFRGMERQYFDFSRAENINASVRVQAADIVGDILHADLDPDSNLS